MTAPQSHGPGSGWKRKLPFSDEQIATAVRLANIPRKKIAEFCGVSVITVSQAVARSEDGAANHRSPNPGFIRARAATDGYVHRDTGKGNAPPPASQAALGYEPDWTAPLEIHECADLIREWRERSE